MLKKMSASLQIGQVAKKTGLTVDAIRFYEKSGLLPRPPRTASGYRLYRDREVADLEFIRKAQHLGFSLHEIRELFSIQRHPGDACAHVRDLIAAKLCAIHAKIADLQKLETDLSSALRQCRNAPRDPCPVLEQIAKARLTVEILYISGCPHHAGAVDRVREVLTQETTLADVFEVEVPDAASAERLAFPGSPTIRVNGRDVEPAISPQRAFGLSCRTYSDGARRAGIPPAEWIRAALREAQRT